MKKEDLGVFKDWEEPEHDDHPELMFVVTVVGLCLAGIVVLQSWGAR